MIFVIAFGLIWWIFIAKRVSELPTTKLTSAELNTKENNFDLAPQAATLAKKLEIPWALDFLPNGGLIFTERPGRVRLIELNEGLIKSPILTINEVAAVGESGLLGIVVHPKFDENHYIYIYYTYSTEGDLANKVVRFEMIDKELINKQVIIQDIPGGSIHNGGRIKFGPDGFLYISTGDAGISDLSQDKSSLGGKILRLTDEGEIPLDNPFSNSPIYSYGHRNPQGLAWDKQKRLWATEHGQTANDEINLIQPGRNYGWPTIQGDEKAENMETPYLHSGGETWAPSGANILNNSLFFTGLRGQSLFELEINDKNKILNRYFERNFGRLRDVVLGPDGFLYLLTSNRDGRALPNKNDDQIIRVNPRKL